MSALLAVVLGSSVVGSLHCVAMCGPLAGMHGGTRSWRLGAAHAAGRLVTYVALGALAGALGGGLDLAARVGALQRFATIAAGATVLGWGAWQLAVAFGWVQTAGTVRLGRFGQGLTQIRTRRPAVRAGLAGVLTGFLPCGWLWAFVITAAGTGSALAGAAVMFAFWLGTVPAMVGLLRLVGPSLGGLRRRMPVVTAVTLILLGLSTLALRWSDAGVGQVTNPTCCDAASPGTDGGSSEGLADEASPGTDGK